MDEDQNKLYEQGMEAYKVKDFLAATSLFCALSYQLLLSENKDGLKDSINMAIQSYTKVVGEPSIHTLFEGSKDDKIEQHFRIVRHYLDHFEETDPKRISQELAREIPINFAEEREIFSEEVESKISTQRLGNCEVSVATTQGPRENMEDAYFLREIIGQHQVLMFGALDGHGGSGCVKYCQETLPEVIKEQFKQLPTLDDLNVYHALTRSFIRVDETWANLPMQKNHLADYSGTTATVCLLLDDNAIWTASAGDSRAILCQDKKIIQLSEDAKPTNEAYLAEVYFRGGYVMWGRVDGTLDMARAIGDIGHPSVSARPTITKVDVNDQEFTLIIACDGLWDVVDPHLANRIIQDKDTESAAKALVSLANERGSNDNITVIVVERKI